MDMDRIAGRYRQMKRATPARSVLDVIALIFIGCAFAFWWVAFWQLLAPPSLLSLGTVSVLVLTVVYSLAAPLLLSMLVPTTPAGQMLQKTQWATAGFPVIVAAALFLCWQGFALIGSWLSAQGGIDQASGLPILIATGQVAPMSISLVIAFILIPALAWIQVSPEMWLQQIQQAHAVKKLDLHQRGELAIIKAKMLRAERLAIVPWVNLLPLEQEEIMQTVSGLLMGQSDMQRDIVRTLGLGADLERSIMDDQEIADRLDYVKQQINVLPDVALVRDEGVATAQTAMAIRTPGPSERAEAAPAPYTKPHTGAGEPDRRGSSQMIPHYEEYTVAYEHYHSDTAWSVKMLAEVLGIEPETAAKRRRAWEGVGLVTGEGLSNGRYRFLA